jgi:carbon-monoxide dehydrogenase medium subunit
MYPASFEYHRAGSVSEALSLLERFSDEGKIIAGGHSLLPVMKLRFAQPAHLIDIRRVPELQGIREEDGRVVIGAATTHAAVAGSELIRRRVPVLAEAAALIGDPLVRNMGTIGGSLAHADPAADLPAVVLALGAEVRARGRQGERTIAADDFFVDLFTSALAADELLTQVRVPVPPASTGGAYEKYPDPASGYAVVGVAALITLGPGGVVQRARIGLTGLGQKATRATAVEQALTGQGASAAAIEAACQRVAEGLDLSDDAGGSAAYKTNLAAVYARRAVTRAMERAGR